MEEYTGNAGVPQIGLLLFIDHGTCRLCKCRDLGRIPKRKPSLLASALVSRRKAVEDARSLRRASLLGRVVRAPGDVEDAGNADHDLEHREALIGVDGAREGDAARVAADFGL